MTDSRNRAAEVLASQQSLTFNPEELQRLVAAAYRDGAEGTLRALKEALIVAQDLGAPMRIAIEIVEGVLQKVSQ